MLEALFPYECILCADPGDGRDLCRACTDDLPWLAGSCLPALPLSFAALAYDFPVDQLILHLKFRQGLVAGRVLGELLAEGLRRGPWERPHGPRFSPDLIIPIPLHPSRLRERGHNQALEIARPVSKALGIPIRHRWCRRIRATDPQSDLTGPARRKNMVGAFEADPRVAGHSVALVDDVFTTGSTTIAASEALFQAGARAVHIWCVAKA